MGALVTAATTIFSAIGSAFGAATGFVSSGLAAIGITGPAATILSSALVGAGIGALTSVITGGDIGTGALWGAAGGALSGAMSLGGQTTGIAAGAETGAMGAETITSGVPTMNVEAWSPIQTSQIVGMPSSGLPGMTATAASSPMVAAPTPSGLLGAGQKTMNNLEKPLTLADYLTAERQAADKRALMEGGIEGIKSVMAGSQAEEDFERQKELLEFQNSLTQQNQQINIPSNLPVLNTTIQSPTPLYRQQQPIPPGGGLLYETIDEQSRMPGLLNSDLLQMPSSQIFRR